MSQLTEDEPYFSGSSAALPTAAFQPEPLLQPLPHSSVSALLRDAVCDVAGVGTPEGSRRKVALHQEDDFNTFYIPPAAHSCGGHQPTQEVPSDGTNAAVARRAITGAVTGLVNLAPPSRRFASNSDRGLFRRAFTEGIGARVSPLQGGAHSGTSTSPFEGFATAYLHEVPRVLGINLFRATGPLFLLRAGRPLKNAPAQAPTAKVGAAAAEQQDITSLASRFASRSDGVHALDPFVLSESEKEVKVIVYKQMRKSERTVIELLHHCVFEELQGGEIVVSFQPFDEEALKETDRVAFDDLDDRRRAVMSKGYSVVSGKESGFLALSPDPIGCSQVQMVIKAEYEVELDDATRTYLLRQVFAPLHATSEAYKRCDWVDDMARKHCINVTIPAAPEATADELARIDKALAYNLDDHQFLRVRGSLTKYPTISMFVGAGSSDKLVWGKGYGDVDAALEEVFAYAWESCSYERMAVHRRKHGGLLRVTDAEDGKRSQIVTSEQKTVPTFANRWFRTRFTWLRLDSGIVAVAFEPANSGDSKMLFTPGSGEGKLTGLYLFQEVSARITAFTIVQSVDLGREVPKWFAESLVPAGCSLILRAQEKFRRPDRVVDKELREAVAARIQCSVVGVHSVEKVAFDDCVKLKDNFNEETSSHLVKILKPPSPFVAYSMRPAQNAEGKAGKRQVGTGKATAVVDTSATVAAAWIFDYCSRDRMRINKEDNRGLPRIKSRMCGPNSSVFGSVKRAPFPLWIREFVIRMSWARVDDDRLHVWAQSANEIVDYGMPNIRKVTGSTSLIWEIFQSQGQVSEVTLYQQLDFGGWVPISVVNEKIGGALIVVSNLRDAFQRDEEVDFENRRTFVAELKDSVSFVGEADMGLSGSEHSVFQSVVETFQTDASESKHLIDSREDHFVRIFRHSAPRSSSRISRRRSSERRSTALNSAANRIYTAEAVIDNDIFDCVAWKLLTCSRRRQQSFFDNDGGAFRKEGARGDRRLETVDTYLETKKRGGIFERRVVSEMLWREQGVNRSSFIVVDYQHPETAERVRLHVRRTHTTNAAVMRFDSEENFAGSISQTKIVMKFAVGPRSLASTEEAQVRAATRHLSELRKCFDKSLEIDRRRREGFCDIVKASKEVYTEQEIDFLDEGMKMFSHLEGQVAKAIAMTPPTTKAKKAYVAGDRRAWGWSSATVRASAMEVLAFVVDPFKRSSVFEDDLEKGLDDVPNDHSHLLYVKKRTPIIIDNRDFLSRVMWRATVSGGIDFVSAPEESERRKRQEGVVRATYPSALRIFKVAENEAKLEYVIHPDSGGSIPSWVLNFYFATSLAYVTEIQDYFQRLRPLRSYDEKDGAAIGETFMITKKEKQGERRKGLKKYEIRVANVVNIHAAMKDFSTLHPWFPSLVEGMLSRRLRGMKKIGSKLENMSNKEALTIGHSFSAPLRARKSAQAGCDVWINEYPALVLFAKRERFFVPMVQTIGQRKIETAPWGLRWKVGLGAGLGMLDVATDVYAIANFTLQGSHGYARAVIAGVSVSMAIQLLIVYANGRKRGRRHVLKEAIIVLSGLKPAVDAFRVSGGAKMHEDETFDPMYELIIAKIVEIVAESIPSALVQTYALLTARQAIVSAASIASIVVSVATVSLGSTTVCFDFDLDPASRVHTPDFYGYVPNSSGKRTVVFYSMFFFTACHVALRLLGIALLAAFSPLITATVLGGDMIFFFLCKLARNDLRYWLKLPGALSWTASIVVRLFTKLMVDFTVMVQLRHPQEIGGLYWCMCLLLGQATSFVAVHLYYSASVGAIEDSATSTVDLWGLLGGLEALFFFFFAIFISTVDKKYVRTFFSTVTAKQFNHRLFRDASKDEARIVIFLFHPSYYEGIRSEVEEWVRENWDIWIEERPEWFTERVQASVPKDMVP